MGIYIPHMKLPERCKECPFFVDEDFTWCGRANYNVCDGLVGRDSKPNWCDLVNVPPHGRLVDADAMSQDETVAFISAQEKMGHDVVGWQVNTIVHAKIQKLIDDTPTIIPADPAEEGEG